MRSLLVALGFLGLLFSACTSLPPECDPQRAVGEGLSTAMQGKPRQEKVPEACREKYGADYVKGYQEGYDRGVTRYCNASSMEEAGQKKGEAGEPVDFNAKAYAICTNRDAMEAFYRRGYKDGLSTFCAAEGAEAAGRAYGNQGRPPAFPEDRYRICGKDAAPMLTGAYTRGYDLGLSTFCKGADLESQGYKEGSEGTTPQAVESRFGKCPAADRQRAVQAYQTGYARGLEAYCQPAQVEALARENADGGGTDQLPQKYARCLTRYPDLTVRYAAAFATERKHVVQSRCTFDQGKAQGIQDAEAANEKHLAQPDFCDATTFVVYTNGYQEGWKTTKDRLCDANQAYDRGRQDARQGSRLEFTLPANCPPEYQSPLYESYRRGYYSWQGMVQGNALTYSPVIAHEACLRAGYSRFECEGVTSIACLETGHKPYECRISSGYMVAVDACLRRRFSPFQCRDVKDRVCIDQGRSPFQCETAPLQ